MLRSPRFSVCARSSRGEYMCVPSAISGTFASKSIRALASFPGHAWFVRMTIAKLQQVTRRQHAPPLLSSSSSATDSASYISWSFAVTLVGCHHFQSRASAGGKAPNLVLMRTPSRSNTASFDDAGGVAHGEEAVRAVGK